VPCRAPSRGSQDEAVRVPRLLGVIRVRHLPPVPLTSVHRVGNHEAVEQKCLPRKGIAATVVLHRERAPHLTYVTTLRADASRASRLILAGSIWTRQGSRAGR
jgi:hypothetical protein